MADAAPLNVTPVSAANVERMINPQKLPAYVGPTGSIEGTITVTGDPAADLGTDFTMCPDGSTMFGHEFREGTPKSPLGPRWLADAVIAVTGYEGYFVPEKNEAEDVTIKGCGFDRRTVTMTFGQYLAVKNLSKEFWTPMLDKAPNAVMRMAFPGGDAVKLYPKEPGRLHLYDHDRKYAVVDVYVFRHSLHTSSATEGAYRIDGIPLGKVKVNAIHPKIPTSEASADIEIKEGVVHRVDLALSNHRPDAGAANGASQRSSAPRVH